MSLNTAEILTKIAKLDVQYVVNQDCPLFTQAKGSQRFFPIGADGSIPKVESYCSKCKGKARVAPDNDRFPATSLPKECRKDETVWDKIADLVARIPRPKNTKRVEATTPGDWEKVK